MKSFQEFLTEQNQEYKKAENAFAANVKKMFPKLKFKIVSVGSDLVMEPNPSLSAKEAMDLAKEVKKAVVPFGYIAVTRPANGHTSVAVIKN